MFLFGLLLLLCLFLLYCFLVFLLYAHHPWHKNNSWDQVEVLNGHKNVWKEKRVWMCLSACVRSEKVTFLWFLFQDSYICNSGRTRALNLSLYAGKPADGGWSPGAPCGQVHWEFMTPHSLRRSLKLAFATGETTLWKGHVMGQENKRNKRQTRQRSWKLMNVDQEELDLQCIMGSNNSKYTLNNLFSKDGGCLERDCSVLLPAPPRHFPLCWHGALQLAMNGRTC